MTTINESKIIFLQEAAERRKAEKFVRKYYKEHGSMPEVEAVKEAKVLTPAEINKIAIQNQIDNIVDKSEKESPANWEYICNEETWNASYANGGLKRYYEWADIATKPYKEDLWNTVANRAANWNDIEKDEQGKPIEYEDGYHYTNCVRCWLGALNAPEAKYPWAVVLPPVPFKGTIRFVYDGGEEVYPWGEDAREFKRGFGCASIPTELGEEFILHDGQTTFNPSKLEVTLVKA